MPEIWYTVRIWTKIGQILISSGYLVYGITHISHNSLPESE